MRILLLSFLLGGVACSSEPGLVDDRIGPPPPGGRNDAGGNGTSSSGGSSSGGGPNVPDGACDRSKPFGPKADVPGLSTSESNRVSARFSADELTVVFAQKALDATHTGFDLYYARRQSRDAAFGTAVPLSNLNTDAMEMSPALSADGTMLYFERPAEGSLYRARQLEVGSFSAPEPLVGLPPGAQHPTLASSGSELFFTNFEPPEDGSAVDLWRIAMVDGLPSGSAERLAGGVNTAEPEALSTWDERGGLLYFQRVTADGYVQLVSRRDGNLFGEATAVPGMPEGSALSWISDDGCRAYLSTDYAPVAEPDRYRIEVITREP